MDNPFVKLHISILLAGFTGILGKLIELPATPLVWYRLLFTVALFGGYLWYRGALPRLPLRASGKLVGLGALMALHWVLFYGSIKFANVSIAVVCFALIGFFSAIFEPLAAGKKISFRELAYSLITVFGIALIFHFDTRYRTGIVLGVLSAVVGAMVIVCLRRLGSKHAASDVFFLQMLGGLLSLSLFAPIYVAYFPEAGLVPSGMDLVWLLALSSACTIGLFILQIQALQKISAFTVSLSYNLEPVYSIVLATLLFGEAGELGLSFAVGLTCIVVSVCLQSLYVLRHMRQHRNLSQRSVEWAE